MAGKIEQAGALLARARLEQRRIRLPQTLRPDNASEAYAIQDAVSRALGKQVRAWKVGAPDPVSEPSAAPIFEVLRGPATLASPRTDIIGVEAEIAALFGSDLPLRSEPYTEPEVLCAVSAICVAIEVCDSRLEDWQDADDMTKLADHQLNHALVLGDCDTRFRDIDFRQLAVRTTLDGKQLREGRGCHAVGNPLRLLPWLANHARMRSGIAAGTAVTTGAWLGMHQVPAGATVVVEFAGIGRAEVSLPG